MGDNLCTGSNTVESIFSTLHATETAEKIFSAENMPLATPATITPKSQHQLHNTHPLF